MIVLSQVKFSYGGDRTVLEDISFRFKEGHIYGLLGENGVGKTTLLKGLAGLVFPKTGSIRVMGEEPRKRNPAFLSEIFVISEDFMLPAVSVKRYVRTWAPFYPKFDETLFHSLLVEFRVPSDARLNELSFGQRKKVLIAFGLATQSKILLMDEPTNGLDIPSKSQFRKVIARELTEDRCFIISTHQVRDLDNLMDELVILAQKRIWLATSIQQIQTSFAFKIVDRHSPELLYSEQTLQGIQALLPNENGLDTKIDLELFFKASLLNREKINALLIKKHATDEQVL